MLESEVAKLVAALVAAYPNARVTERTCQVYEAMLTDLDFGAAQMASARLIATTRFLPTIAEIRAAVVDMTLGPRRTGIEAWGDVVAEIGRLKRAGPSAKPQFDDEDVAAVVKSLGWHQLCFGDSEASDRARFVEAYEIASKQRRLEIVCGRATPALAGVVAGRLKR